MSTFLYGANVQANGIRQHFLRYGRQSESRGDRDAVVIIPGITSPAVTWAFVGERFGQYFDTYVLDVRGRGLSEAGPSLDYSLDAQAADLIAFCEALDLTRYSWVGHSMGARIAVRAAASSPEGLSRLVLVDPPMSGPGRRPYPSNLAWYVDSIRLSRRGMSIDQMREFCPTWTEKQLSLRAEWLHTCDERAVVTSFEGFHVDDIHSNFNSIKQNVLLVTAERGDVVNDADVAEIRAMIPDLEHIRVSDAGHMIPWDNEEGFYRAFGQFLGDSLG
ncbi:alpha/beta hydrolase [Burkholderia cenocepacia]|uniref:alpha/beta fold hydrolase n=1 Tax=Burkholderia anthinoferrum TaxID=3090833 RepID=UPI000CE25B6E|nr:alpha/beta hydrolase [Burkholderia anthinoferrum]RQU68172.1 alpha/beta hydrolase [Burkholderia cenocepacia]RQZ85420.1 alpha/beta hydrolase [Burkholderia cenocepacia]RRA05960.1 alpha/beta hydrolase [Burkholderia cenocepacia]